MNLLQTLWGWLASLFAKAPAPAIEEQECCEEECEPEQPCCDHEECEPAPEPIVEVHIKEEPTPVVVEEVITTPAPVGELLREILVTEGISEAVIEKYQIVEAFEGWYDGTVDADSVRASIQGFKSAHGGAVSAKLSRVK
jgi:hypothetical protein